MLQIYKQLIGERSNWFFIFSYSKVQATKIFIFLPLTYIAHLTFASDGMEMLLGSDSSSSGGISAAIFSWKDQSQGYTNYVVIAVMVKMALTQLVSSLFPPSLYLQALRWIWPACNSQDIINLMSHGSTWEFSS